LHILPNFVSAKQEAAEQRRREQQRQAAEAKRKADAEAAYVLKNVLLFSKNLMIICL
jgi:hypothetical protein